MKIISLEKLLKLLSEIKISFMRTHTISYPDKLLSVLEISMEVTWHKIY